MATYRPLLDAIAQIVGGTQPTLTQAQAGLLSTAGLMDAATIAKQQPYWFSGLDAATNDGVTGIAGCYSVPTEKIVVTPLAMVIPDGWQPNAVTPFPMQGKKYRDDRVAIRLFVGHNDMQTALAQLEEFADLVPTQFDTHMRLLSKVDTADCSHGRFLEVDWGGDTFFAVEFIVTATRSISVTRIG